MSIFTTRIKKKLMTTGKILNLDKWKQNVLKVVNKK